MRTLSAGLAALVLTAAASVSLAAIPQVSIHGPGSSPGIEDGSNFVIMESCPGPIASGWGLYGTSGWKVAQQFIPTLTTTPLGVKLPVSDNGFSTFTVMASIYTDGGGGVPGALITASTPVTITGAPSYPAAVVAKLRFTRQTTLTAGTTYVLLLEAPTGACFVDGNSTGGCPGTALQTVDGGITWPPIATDVCRAIYGP